MASIEKPTEFRSLTLSPARRLILPVVLLVVTAAGCGTDDDVSWPTATESYRGVEMPAIEKLHEEATTPPTMLASLELEAGDAAIGYFLTDGSTVGSGVGASWVLDLSDNPRAAERASYGLLALGIPFERVGDDWNVLQGVGPGPSIERVTNPAATLAAVAERSGSVTGQLFVGLPEDAAAVSALAYEVGLDPLTLFEQPDDGSDEAMVALQLTRQIDWRTAAGWATTCADRLPIVGGRGCLERSGAEQILNPVVETDWLVATTGPIGDTGEDVSTSDGGVSWSNLEAQRYVPEAVQFVDGGVELEATHGSSPSIDLPPYESGMIISVDTYGNGRFDFEASLPAGAGLWPAIWLLDAEACEAPGRCEGYETSDYHEIDVIETQGQSPEVGHTSVHWWDEQIRSASGETFFAALADSHTFTLDRRPGLLQWFVDDSLVYQLAGLAEADRGLHRTAPMRVVINLAVGGSFAGERQLGRGSSWLGDSRVPAGYPDPGWDQAILHLAAFGFRQR